MPNQLTVIMPVFNAAKYLRESIESILNQTFDDFEFLIIDDCSTDESVQIIQSYKDPRIRLVKNEKNHGISETLNIGLRLSNSDLIARMDADDISYPERLDKQIEYFKNNPETVLLSTSVRVITSRKEVVEEYRVSHFYNCYNLNFNCPIYHPTVMFKRLEILAVNGYTFKYSEDFDLWWRVSRKFKIDHIDEMLLDYRLSSISISMITLKPEYDESSRELLLRNLKYYAGPHFKLTYNEAEAYRNIFEPICEGSNVWEMVTCIKKLEYLNKLIIERPNLNYSGLDLLQYANVKKEYTIYHLYNTLPHFKRVLFLLFSGNASFLFRRIRQKMRRYSKSLKPKFYRLD